MIDELKMAMRSGDHAQVDAVLMDILQVTNGCEGGAIAWEGELPTCATLTLSVLCYIVEFFVREKGVGAVIDEIQHLANIYHQYLY